MKWLSIKQVLRRSTSSSEVSCSLHASAFVCTNLISESEALPCDLSYVYMSIARSTIWLPEGGTRPYVLTPWW